MTQRLDALDVLRGMTVLAMIVVNNPGTWAHVYPPLLHAHWHGCTPTDLIFPFFLFVVGAGMAFALAKHAPGAKIAPTPRGVNAEPRADANADAISTPARAPELSGAGSGRIALYIKIFRRALVLVALGLALNAFLTKDLSQVRLPGVLQRIGLCYFLVAMLVLHLRVRWQVLVGAAVLLAYWALLRFVPVPELPPDSRKAFELLGEGGLSNTQNWARWLDLRVLGERFTWSGSATDPEGLLSTLSASVTTLMGYWAGVYLRSRPRPTTRAALVLAVAGCAGIGAGLAWSLDQPANKTLWTSAYVLLTAGWATVFLAGWYWLGDVRGWRWTGVVSRAAGKNAILLFVASGVAARLLGYHTLATGNATAPSVTLKVWLYETFCVPLGAMVSTDPRLASLLFALANLLVWSAVAVVLARRGWFWKVG
jgi:predicted acyltransferase